MAEIQLWTNSNPLDVTVGIVDRGRHRIRVKPNEAFFDKDGYVRLFSMRFDDGTYGNFKLLPDNETADTVLRICKRILVPFGLTIVGGVIFSGNTIIHNLAQELFEQGGSLLIEDFFKRYSIANSSYYAIENGEHVFAESIQLSLR